MEPPVRVARFDHGGRSDPEETRRPAAGAGNLVQEDAGVVGQSAGEAEAGRHQVNQSAGVAGRPIMASTILTTRTISLTS